jgi:hypothetical protein
MGSISVLSSASPKLFRLTERAANGFEASAFRDVIFPSNAPSELAEES